jgi:hypothetical protein
MIKYFSKTSLIAFLLMLNFVNLSAQCERNASHEALRQYSKTKVTNDLPFSNFLSGDDSKTLYVSAATATAYKGTVANPFGPQIGYCGIGIQCTEYIDGVLYAVSFIAGTGNQFGTVDTETGAWAPINNNFDSDGVSLSYNPVNGKVYVTPWTGLSYGPIFGTVDIETGNVTPITIMPQGYEHTYYMAIDNDGIAYAVRNTTNQFGTINLETGAFTQTATLPFEISFIQDMSIDRETNELYWMARRSGVDPTYYKVNKETGALTPMGTTSYDESPQSFSILTNYTPIPDCLEIENVEVQYDADCFATVSWEAAIGSLKYNVYLDNVLVATEISETTYTHDVALSQGIEVEWCITQICTTGDESEAGCATGEICYLNIRDLTSIFTIKPNPASESITINAEYNLHTIELINPQGKIVFSQPNVGNCATIEISFLPKGIYFVRITSDRGAFIKKLVKQ